MTVTFVVFFSLLLVTQSQIIVYVNNSYSGASSDGSITQPYTTICDGLNETQALQSYSVEILVANTGISYSFSDCFSQYNFPTAVSLTSDSVPINNISDWSDCVQLPSISIGAQGSSSTVFSSFGSFTINGFLINYQPCYFGNCSIQFQSTSNSTTLNNICFNAPVNTSTYIQATSANNVIFQVQQ